MKEIPKVAPLWCISGWETLMVEKAMSVGWKDAANGRKSKAYTGMVGEAYEEGQKAYEAKKLGLLPQGTT